MEEVGTQLIQPPDQDDLRLPLADEVRTIAYGILGGDGSMVEGRERGFPVFVSA
jgi:hypothetical protein